ncbi:flavin reductase family protein [Streptomyces sp. NPDC000609]|uniref:Flavin reductase family protein n=1 Tax=Streptomyces pulveraceus TaxID=68258 RepID=A0ABW1GT31_9ACTN
MTTTQSAAPPRTPDDTRRLRACLGNFLTGVTVVTCRRGPEVHGITVNSFTSVSMDPPLVLVGLDRRSRAAGHLASGPYAINFLTEQQRELALHFAGRPMSGPVRWTTDTDGTPLLADTLGHLVCRPWRHYDGGDHLLLIGAVTGFEVHGGRPLAFFRGAFPELAAQDMGAPWSGSLDDPVTPQQITAFHQLTREGHA